MSDKKKRRSQRDHIEAIKRWQETTGRTGAPPRAYDEKLSNYIQWCRRFPDSPAAVAFEIEVGPLGISFKKGATSAHRIGEVDFSHPRGFAECRHVAQKYLDSGLCPSLLAENESERHLAGWCIRASVGLVSHRHVPLDPANPSAIHLAAFIRDIQRVQSPRQFAAEWYCFAARVAKQMAVATKGSAWCEYACQRAIGSVFPRMSRLRSDVDLLLQGRTGLPSLPSPDSVIAAINRVFGSLPHPVTFPYRRSSTTDATTRLLSAGFRLHDAYPERA